MRRIVATGSAFGLSTLQSAVRLDGSAGEGSTSTTTVVRSAATTAGGGESGKQERYLPSNGELLHIGDVSVKIRHGDHPEKVPSALCDGPSVSNSFFPLNSETLSLLRWIAQKELLGQDVCLLGEPGPARRWLAMLYCRYAQREVQTLSLSRDTTESDLKQRKEIRQGTLKYLNQAAVTAALNGHILVLEGLERAERNVLPVLNNLLENREMNLDNGQMLVHPDRYDRLVSTMGKEEVEKLGLLRVSEHFRVIGLAVPVPKYPGNPLDPPLRSRFQCLNVPAPSLDALWKTLSDAPQAADTLLKFKVSLTETVDKGSDGDKKLNLDPLGEYEVLELAQQHNQFPQVPFGALLSRVYPWQLYLLRLSASSSNQKGKGSVSTEEAALRNLLARYKYLSTTVPDSQHLKEVLLDTANRKALITLKDNTAHPAMCGPLSRDKPWDGTTATNSSSGGPGFYTSKVHLELISALLQSHGCSRHICLVGGPGCGKTAVVREFAAALGYPVHTQHLFADMSTRDFFQRRSTDAHGDTVWEPSGLIQAAKLGHLAVLDGVDNLPPHSMSVLQELLVDGSATLLDGTMYKPLLEYEHLKTQWKLSDAEMTRRGVFAIHPAFRVIALARPPTTKHGKKFWLTNDVACLFNYHLVPELDSHTVEELLMHLIPVSDPGVAVTAKQQREMIQSLIVVQGELVKLLVEDPKIPQLSLRQLIRVVNYASRHPNELEPVLASSLLVHLLSPIAADLVVKQFAAAGLKTAGKSVTAKLSHSVSGWMGSNSSRQKRSPELDEEEVKIEIPKVPNAEMIQVERSQDPATSEYKQIVLSGQCVYDIKRTFTSKEKLLIPHVMNYFANQEHTNTLAWLAKQLGLKNKILLVGNQGVGKNKVVDHFLSIIGLPRQYIQLHRDTTVASLTINPRVESGAVVWEDSPLVKAVSLGHVLVIDEIDKAPVDVVQVLKGLVEDKEMTLSDGRRISAWKEVEEGEGPVALTSIIRIHPDFRLIVLANPPGYPFHGNDFYRECGDLFASHVLENPDIESQTQLLIKYAPNVPITILSGLIHLFDDLRKGVTVGTLQYPFSLRELIHVVKHLEAYPQDGVAAAMNNVFHFDSFDPQTLAFVRAATSRRIKDYEFLKDLTVEPFDLQKALLGANEYGAKDLSDRLEQDETTGRLTGGIPVPCEVMTVPKRERITFPVLRLAALSDQTVGSGASDLFTEMRSLITLPLEANGYMVEHLAAVSLEGGLTVTLSKVESQGEEGSASLRLIAYATPNTNIHDVARASRLSLPVVGSTVLTNLSEVLGAGDSERSKNLVLSADVKDNWVMVSDQSTGEIFIVNPLTGEADKQNLFDPPQPMAVSSHEDYTELQGIVTPNSQPANETIHVRYLGHLIKMTLPSEVTSAISARGLTAISIIGSSSLLLTDSEGSDSSSSKFLVNVELKDTATATGQVFKVAQIQALPSYLKGAEAASAANTVAFVEKNGTSAATWRDEWGQTDFIDAAKMAEEVGGNVRGLPTKQYSGKQLKPFNQVTDPKGAQSAVQAVKHHWDHSLKQRTTYDPVSGNLVVASAAEGHGRVINVKDLYTQMISASVTASASASTRGSQEGRSASPSRAPLVVKSGGGTFSTVGANHAGVVDANYGRVQKTLKFWRSASAGAAQKVGGKAAGDPKDLDMRYSQPKKKPSGSLKHGEEDPDNTPHVGGNNWAGGTGGTDTAGLGGLVGPYRLDKGHKIHQVDPEEKKKVPKHIVDEAKAMGKRALEKRLAEIGMSDDENARYTDALRRVQGSINNLQLMFNGLKAREGDRVWLKNQSDGVWDDTKIVEGITGERNIYKRRGESADTNQFQHKLKKRLCFVVDVSASMYRFNGQDGRLTRLVETCIMIMESFTSHEDKISYAIYGHSGNSSYIPFVDYDEPPQNKKERLRVVASMVAHSQYTWSGDHTVEAMEKAVPHVTAEPGDDYFVFVISDANLAQYGISPRHLSQIINSDPKVHMYCLFIASFGSQASDLSSRLPAGKGYEIQDAAQMPLILKRIFVAADLLSGA